MVSRLVDVEFILVREFFVLEELVLLGQEFLKGGRSLRPIAR
jgi:hypothetical protein